MPLSDDESTCCWDCCRRGTLGRLSKGFGMMLEWVDIGSSRYVTSLVRFRFEPDLDAGVHLLVRSRTTIHTSCSDSNPATSFLLCASSTVLAFLSLLRAALASSGEE